MLTKVSPLGAMVPGTIAGAGAATTGAGTNGESHESLILQSSGWTCDDHLLRNDYVWEPTNELAVLAATIRKTVARLGNW